MSNGRLIIRNARVLTMLAPGEALAEGVRPGARRGAGMRELGVIPSADVVVDVGRGRIVEVGPHASSRKVQAADEVIDADGRVLMPGFVDCHTHALWVGSRVDEWERKLAGATYQQIAAAGGGIMSSVRAVRAASNEGLRAALDAHLRAMRELGTTTVEVKSGYGLTCEHELRMIETIKAARESGSRARDESFPSVAATALLGHAIDLEFGASGAGGAGGEVGGAGRTREAFVRETIERTLPAAVKLCPGVAVDAFCEQGAWNLEECTRLFRAAQALGCPIRVHADQFTSMGMVGRAIELGARSVDHLEASTDEDIALLGKSESFGVILPACGFHLDGRYAKGRALIDAGTKLCIATNFNPGSAPCMSMGMVIALAVRHGGLTPAEAIVASTLNPARLLGFEDRGFIAPGARADLLLLKHRDERALAYEFGANAIDRVIAS